MITATATLQSVIEVTAQIVGKQVGNCDDATVTNQAGDYSLSIPSGDTDKLPLGKVKDSDGTDVQVDYIPAADGYMFEATPCAAQPSVSLGLSNGSPRFQEEITLSFTAANFTGTPTFTVTVTNGTNTETIYSGTATSFDWQVNMSGNLTITVAADDGTDSALDSDAISIDGLIMEVITWGGGTNRTEFEVPTVSGGTYNCTVYWINEDGTLDGSDTITTWNDPAWTHTFAEEGTKYVQIVGTFSEISTDTQMKEKVVDVVQWNNVKVPGQMFYVSNLKRVSAIDAPDVYIDMKFMFRGSQLSSINMNAWDISQCPGVDEFLREVTAEIVGWDWLKTIGNQDISGLFNRYLWSGDYHLRYIPWSGVTDASKLLPFGEATTLEDYEQMLINMDANTPAVAFTIRTSNSVYRSGSAAETAKNNLIALGFTFQDGGAI